MQQATLSLCTVYSAPVVDEILAIACTVCVDTAFGRCEVMARRRWSMSALNDADFKMSN